MRTIDADALKKEVENLVVGGAKGLKDYYENGSKSDANAWIGGVYDAWELIDNAPTVRFQISEPKIARWIWQTHTNGFGTFKELCCGECYHKRQQIDLHFCACCGAKMTNADELGGAT